MRTLCWLGALALIAAVAYQLDFSAAPVDPSWQASAADTVPEGAVTVRFVGTTTLLFSDGTTSWMTDGWFSRPSLFSLLLGSITPDLDAIEEGLQAAAVTDLAAVIPLHSHYDHAMDAPEVARRTGALLLGSQATANIGRGWGLAEDQIRVLANGESFQLGDFTLTVHESRHLPYPSETMVRKLIDQWQINEPLVPPASAMDYKLGKAYVLQVQHPAGTILILGSAGFIPGQLQGMQADALFIGVGGLGAKSAAYREEYWRETAERVMPRQLIPIHWDSLLAPIEGPFVGERRLAAGGNTALLEFLQRQRALHPQQHWWTPPRYEPVVLFSP